VDAATQVVATYPSNQVSGAPVGVAVDSTGNLFVADDDGRDDTGNNLTFRIDAATHTVSTVAGGGSCGVGCNFAGDGGPATSAVLGNPSGVAVDSAGNLFITDNNRIRRVDAATKVITTIVGNGSRGFGGDGGPATSAELEEPTGVAVDSTGNLFIAEIPFTGGEGGRVREVISAKQDQTISFAPIPNRIFIPRDSFAISATASSGLPVTFTVGGGGSCTVSGSIAQITGVGSCTITASQAGDASFNPAPEVS
jgi:hypothetical protein